MGFNSGFKGLKWSLVTRSEHGRSTVLHVSVRYGLIEMGMRKSKYLATQHVRCAQCCMCHLALVCFYPLSQSADISLYEYTSRIRSLRLLSNQTALRCIGFVWTRRDGAAGWRKWLLHFCRNCSN